MYGFTDESTNTLQLSIFDTCQVLVKLKKTILQAVSATYQLILQIQNNYKIRLSLLH